MEIKYKFLETAFHGQLRIRLNSAVSSPVRPLLLLSNDKSAALNPILTCCYLTGVWGDFFQSYEENIQHERTSYHRNSIGLFMVINTRILFIIFLEMLNILLLQNDSVLKCQLTMFREEKYVARFVLIIT